MHYSYIQFTFNLQVHLVVIFKTPIDAINYSAFITCRIIWMLRRMKKRPVSIHQDHLADLLEILKDNTAQCKPK